METLCLSGSESPELIKPSTSKKSGRGRQSQEDKRKRNYIAVRKHRQQLKDTLEKCPVELVQLKKKLDTLNFRIAHRTVMAEMLRKMVRNVEEKGFTSEDLETIEKSKTAPESISLPTQSRISDSTEVVPVQQELQQPLQKPKINIRVASEPVTSLSFPLPSLPSTSQFIPQPQPILTTQSLPLPMPVFNPFSAFYNIYQPPPLLNFSMTQQMPLPNQPILMTPENISELWRMCRENLNS